ncbi:MAG: DNA-directed DNA polymerase [Candidatus Altiarchaeota archaeon]
MTTNVLLDADYIVKEDKPVIRLFYRSPKERFIDYITDFKPYFYATPKGDASELKKEIEELKSSRITEVRIKEMTDYGKKANILEVFTKLPSDVASLREEVRHLPSCNQVREADIPFSQRYIINSELVPMQDAESADLLVAAVDIEVETTGGEPNPSKNPITLISYADSHGQKKVWTYKKTDIKVGYLEVLDDEKSIIKALIDEIRTRDVDLLVGYNSDNFDFPYLKERGDKLGVQFALGADGSEVKLERRGMNTGARVRGRPHVDLYPVCRKTYNLSRYRLEDVYLELTGIEKIDLTLKEMDEAWRGDDREKFQRFVEYSLSDAEATLEISKAVLPLQYELARIVRQPIYELSRSGSSQQVELLLMEKAFKKDIIVPNRPFESIITERDGESYVGAYVVDPVKGIHDDILVFDFRSLYPSIVISHNIDVATQDCECCATDGHMAPNKHHFCAKKKGFLPEVLGEIVKRRMEIKAKLKDEKDESTKRLLNVQQHALKILANSFYGYFGFSRARWYSNEAAEAISAWGREYILDTISKAEKAGFKVIYGDTDSIFLVKPELKDKDEIVAAGKKFLSEINSDLPEAMELEFEGYYLRGLFVTKKRYALAGEDGKLTIKGLETKRRDWAVIAKDTQEKVLETILFENDPKKAADIIKETIDRLRSKSVPLKELAINTQITKDLGDYVNEGPHVVAAKKAIKEGLEFKQGSFVRYIVTPGKGLIGEKSVVIELATEGDYDPEYYLNNQLLPAVMRIMEALGYQEDELKGLGKQMTLGGWD